MKLRPRILYFDLRLEKGKRIIFCYSSSSRLRHGHVNNGVILVIIDLCGPHQTKIERKAFDDGCIEGNAAIAQGLVWCLKLNREVYIFFVCL